MEKNREITDTSVSYDLENKRRKANLLTNYFQKQFLKLNLGPVHRFPFPRSYKLEKTFKKFREIKEGNVLKLMRTFPFPRA